MSSNTELSAGFSTAQAEIAGAMGVPDNGKNFIYNGRGYVGVWGQPQVVEIMRGGGGYSRRSQIVLTVTRSQFETAPDTKVQIVRTDITPRENYRIDVLNTDDPFHYVLTCVKVG